PSSSAVARHFGMRYWRPMPPVFRYVVGEPQRCGEPANPLKSTPNPRYPPPRNNATLWRHLPNQPPHHPQTPPPRKPPRPNPAPAAMTAINTSFLNVSGAILSRICCPTYMPSTTGNVAAVETETSSQLNWRLAVRRIASKPEETTRNSDASFVNAVPRSPFAS